MGLRAKMRTMRVLCGTSLAAVFLTASIAALTPLAGLAREVSVQEAVAEAQLQSPGKVLSVQTLNVGKRKIYRIKILTPAGQVRVVQVPAER